MKIVLWLCWGGIAYAYIGYPLWLFVLSRWRTRPHWRSMTTPTVSILIAVRNEAGRIPRKLDNLASLNYPADLVQVVVVSDGSTDETNELLRSRLSDRVRAVFVDQHIGKAACLNRALEVATGDIVVFTDIRQMIEPGALRELLANFADPYVGCVSGELMFGEFSGNGGIAEPLGLYWRMEKQVRRLESATGSVVGATGAFYAARRFLIPALAPGTLLDDVYIPVSIARAGKRVLFEPEARAWDNVVDEASAEFRRKVRTLTGNFQLLRLAPWLLSPFQPLWFRFLSHKMSRLAVPWLMMLAVVLAALIRDVPSIVFLSAFALLLLAALLAIVARGPGLITRLCKTAQAFVVLNTAAAMAFVNFVMNRYGVWHQVPSVPGTLDTQGSESIPIAAGK
jgi:cellulose synthase/poly-beta-1,6-N-acetylglucosamine synthase-like glycosyltransferase